MVRINLPTQPQLIQAAAWNAKFFPPNRPRPVKKDFNELLAVFDLPPNALNMSNITDPKNAFITANFLCPLLIQTLVGHLQDFNFYFIEERR